MQVPALIQKHEQSLRIVTFKAVCRFVVLLLSTFSGFSIFAAGFSFAFGNFTHYCVFLLNAPLGDLGEKKDTCLQWVTFPRKSRSIVDLRGPVALLVRGFRRRDNLLAWHEFANLYELTSRILVLGGIQPLWANMKGPLIKRLQWEFDSWCLKWIELCINVEVKNWQVKLTWKVMRKWQTLISPLSLSFIWSWREMCSFALAVSLPNLI